MWKNFIDICISKKGKKKKEKRLYVHTYDELNTSTLSIYSLFIKYKIIL